MSRGVFRWSRTDRATDVGELKKPEIVTSTIATVTEFAAGIGDAADAHRRPGRALSRSVSGRLLEKRAMKNEPMTKPTDVSASCRPYSNSVASSSRSDIGSSSTFHSPNEKNIRSADQEQRPQDRRPEQRPEARLQVGDDDPDARVVVGHWHRIAAHQGDQDRAHDERERVDHEREAQVDAGKDARARRTRSRSSRTRRSTGTSWRTPTPRRWRSRGSGCRGPGRRIA